MYVGETKSHGELVCLSDVPPHLPHEPSTAAPSTCDHALLAEELH